MALNSIFMLLLSFYVLSHSMILNDTPEMHTKCLEQRTYEWDMRAAVKCDKLESYHCLEDFSDSKQFHELCRKFMYISPGKPTNFLCDAFKLNYFSQIFFIAIAVILAFLHIFIYKKQKWLGRTQNFMKGEGVENVIMRYCECRWFQAPIGAGSFGRNRPLADPRQSLDFKIYFWGHFCNIYIFFSCN